MRYILFSSALILGLELFGTSIAAALPANGAIVKTNPSRDAIQVMQGCGKHHRDRAGQCVAD